MNDGYIHTALRAAERTLALHRNVAHDGLLRYKLKKLIRHPYRYMRVAAYKLHMLGEVARARTFFGAHITVPLSDVNAVDLYYAGCLRAASEGYVTRFLLQTIKPGSIFYDIGANYGFYSVLATFRGAHVHAFDPSSHCAPLLMETFRSQHGYPPIVFNQIALADGAETVEYFDMSAGHKSGMSTINAAVALSSPMAYTTSQVRAMTLDKYVDTHEIPDVIKIDTEGSEALILAGAQRLLSSHSPTIVMEVWGKGQSGAENSARAITLLTEAGYRAHSIMGDGSITPTGIHLEMIGENNNFVFKK